MHQRVTVRRRARIMLTLLTAVAIGVASVVPTLPAGAATDPSGWDAWLLSSPDQFRLQAPPGDMSSTTAQELKRLRKMQSKRGKKQKKQVRFWNKGPSTKRWTEVALDMIVKHRPRPAAAARILALVHNGMFDALVAAYDSKNAYDRTPPADLDSKLKPLIATKGSSYPPPMAVIAGAAEETLTYAFPSESPDTFSDLARQAVRSRMWAGANYKTDVKRGRRLGRDVAGLFIAHGEVDGHTNTGFSHPRPAGENYWEATPPGFEDPVGGPVGTWTPWVIPGPNEIRVESAIPGPFAYGSQEFMDELDEVLDVDDNLTPNEAAIAVFWDDGPGSLTPPGHWNQIALELIKGRKMGTNQVVRLFSYLNTTEMDAAIAYFDAKYFWWSIRPVTVIQRLCDDGMTLCTDDEIQADPNRASRPGWLPHLITPNFPSYPSGHSSFSGSAGAILEHFLPDAAGLLDELANEAAMSRLFGGIHYRSDNDDGLVLGRTVAQHLIDRANADGSGL